MKNGSRISLPLKSPGLDFRHDPGMNLAIEFKRV